MVLQQKGRGFASTKGARDVPEGRASSTDADHAERGSTGSALAAQTPHAHPRFPRESDHLPRRLHHCNREPKLRRRGETERIRTRHFVCVSAGSVEFVCGPDLVPRRPRDLSGLGWALGDQLPPRAAGSRCLGGYGQEGQTDQTQDHTGPRPGEDEERQQHGLARL